MAVRPWPGARSASSGAYRGAGALADAAAGDPERRATSRSTAGEATSGHSLRRTSYATAPNRSANCTTYALVLEQLVAFRGSPESPGARISAGFCCRAVRTFSSEPSAVSADYW